MEHRFAPQRRHAQGCGKRVKALPVSGRWQHLLFLPLCWLLTACCLGSPSTAFVGGGATATGRISSSASSRTRPHCYPRGAGGPWQVARRGRRTCTGGLGSLMAMLSPEGLGGPSASHSHTTDAGLKHEATGEHEKGKVRAPRPSSSIEPHSRRARFELHRTWQSVTSVDVVEDGQIVGTRGGLPCRTSLRWLDKPRNVLLLVKRGSTDILQRGAELAAFLQAREGVRVLVERQVKQDFENNYGIQVAELYGPRNRTTHEVDAVITLGGDGLLMHANWLFQRAAPIILPVNLGSLGFLLPFEYEDIYQSVDRMLTEDVQLTLRMRLSCRIIRNGTVVMNLAVMNDVVVERGSSPYLASLDCFCNGQYITTVQADGIIIATPTGSTAYSMSAGGSMVHPGIQALLMTPICPHSLSFRPLLFPDTSVLSLRMPTDARTYAWISFDGRFRHRLMVGDILEVSKSEYPLPTVTHQNVTADWFASLSKAFNFNQRTRQKPLGLAQSQTECEDPVSCIEPLPPGLGQPPR